MRQEVHKNISTSSSSNQMGRNICPPQKAKDLGPVVLQELENLDKDAGSRRSALKALKSYVKDLDTKAIPVFMAQVSEAKEPGASFGEHAISLYEVLARVHGRNIVPQIDNIMCTIVKTLSTSAGSIPLHQACSKVVPAIARYAIDPSTAAEERTKIIGSLCKPLSDVLMGPGKSLASGAALCLRALVESDNWRFVPDDTVNEVCLTVAGALEEKVTQTSAHMGLVMALSKYNGFTVEAYARSLIRSGMKILADGAAEVNSERRYSAIQMINFLMKCVDSRSIVSEIGSVVEAMEGCRTDRMPPFVRGAAFEALQTAVQLVDAHKGTKYEPGPSPMSLKWVGGGSALASPESRTIDSSFAGESLMGPPLPDEQVSPVLEHGRRCQRRLWNKEAIGVDESLRFPRAGNQSQAQAQMSPQDSWPPICMAIMRSFATPRRLMRSLQDTVDADSWNPDESADVADHSHNQESRSAAKEEKDGTNAATSKAPEDGGGSMLEASESVSSCEVVSMASHSDQAPGEVGIRTKSGTQSPHVANQRLGKPVIISVCGLFLILVSLVLAILNGGDEEQVFGMVPT